MQTKHNSYLLGRKALKDFLYAAISVNLYQQRAYPSETFKPVFVFGTPAKILQHNSVRRYIMKTLNSLQLSEDGQQELILRYSHPERGGCCDVVFRFQCFASHSDTYSNLDYWKEAFGSALGRLWLRPLPVFNDASKVRNWFQSGSADHQTQTAPSVKFVDAEVPSHGLRSCFPVLSINRADLNFQILYAFLDPAPSLPSNDTSKADDDRSNA